MSDRKPVNTAYQVVTFKKPIQWARTEDEVWMLNPPRRYVLNASQLENLAPYVDTVSDLKNARHYKPLNATTQLRGAKILIERCRDRGIGDMLFLTGPMSYLQHITGGKVHLDVYGLVDRMTVLTHHPALAFDGVLAGPILYDDLPLYQAHWFVDVLTETDETKDQLNVYDALYRQIGLDPAIVPPLYKRPSMQLVRSDFEALDSLYYVVNQQRNIDLRTMPYYVLAPISHSSLRVAPYQFWLQLAQELSKVRPVIFVGHVAGDGRVPSAGITFGAFQQAANNLGPRVINLMGNTSLRAVAALISKAVAAVTLDSGLLYVAQALNTPTVSLWGTHSPMTRIGYDQAYMQYAIWQKQACPASPCFAYSGFPHDRCPRGSSQSVCEVLAAVLPSDVVAKITEIEQKNQNPVVTVKKS